MVQEYSRFTTKVISLIKQIPPGSVATYGQIAASAGSPRAARQVVRILHATSHSRNLPWHRVINRQGNISLAHGEGFEEQATRLSAEGIPVDEQGHISLAVYQHRFTEGTHIVLHEKE